MNIFSEQNFARINFLCAVILVTLLTISTGVLFIANKFDTLKKDLIDLEQQFIIDQKEQVKTDVLTLEAHIASRHQAIEKFLEQRLMERIEEARMTAQNIYDAMRGKVSEKEVADTIRDAIRPIRFNEKLGYCFIFNLLGEVILYPANTALEGTNFFTNKVDGGPEVVEDLIKIVGSKERGFYRYNWTKPNDTSGNRYQKLSYVTLFEPLGWVIGTGEYIDTLDALTQETIIGELQESLRGDITDYFFLYKLHNVDGGEGFATMIINNNRPDLVGKKLSDDYVDAKGNQFRKEFLQGIRESGEAFVIYWYKKPDGSGTGRKLSYFKRHKEWNWIIAKGIYFDRLDAEMATKKEELSRKVKKDIVMLCFIYLVGVMISLAAAFYLSRALQKILNQYRRTQEEHLQELEMLNIALEKQSNTDVLTQIRNRSSFNQCLTREIALAGRYNKPLPLIIFDIDRFKTINDTLGHLAGDSVLRELASLISGNIRQSDIFARWGGEEFTLLAPNIDREQTSLFMEKLRMLVETHAFSVGCKITCSFGGAMYTSMEAGEDLLRRADEALYQAKSRGRNRWVVQ
jgi:diguanylate cyclase (GGDEF)-like protein